MKKELLLSAVVALAAGCSAPATKHFDVKDYEYAMGEKYLAQWNDEENARIDRDIEKYRKADGVFALNVPAGTDVQVEQTRHAFLFGAQCFNYRQLESAEKNAAYERLFQTLFNGATIPMFWKESEPEKGKLHTGFSADDCVDFWAVCSDREKQRFWRRPAITPIIDFCDRNDLRKHGHLFFWGNTRRNVPNWLLKDIRERYFARPVVAAKVKWVDEARTIPDDLTYNAIFEEMTPEEFAKKEKEFVAELDQLWFDHMDQLIRLYGNRIDSWDVVNEASIEMRPDENDNARLVENSAICRSFYGPMPGDYVARAFLCAKMKLPESAKLFINDYAMCDSTMQQLYVDLISQLKKRQCRIDGIGCQVHLFQKQVVREMIEGKSDYHSPRWVRDAYQKLSALDTPIRISEITIPALTCDEKGEAEQAVLAYNLYRLWFSLEKVEGITWWNLIDGLTAGKEKMFSGILRPDMSKKPVYFALDDLINRQWKTKLTVKADKDGKISFRGFRGTYKATWKEGGKERVVSFKL